MKLPEQGLSKLPNINEVTRSRAMLAAARGTGLGPGGRVLVRGALTRHSVRPAPRPLGAHARRCTRNWHRTSYGPAHRNAGQQKTHHDRIGRAGGRW